MKEIDKVESKVIGNTTMRSPVWTWLPSIIVFVLGILISFFAWKSAKTAELGSINTGFQLEAEAYAGDVARNLSLFQDVTASLRALHSISENINPDAFSEFVDKGMMHQKLILGAFGFSQYIPASLRPAYEDALSDEPDQNNLIKELKGNDVITASERLHYFPLTYQSQPNALGIPIGYDFGSTPQNMRAILHMFSTRKTVFGSRIPGSVEDKHIKGRFVFAPIMKAEWDENSQMSTLNPVGFVVSILNPDRLLESLVPLPESKGMHAAIVESYTYSAVPEPLKFKAVLNVANEQWTFLCTASKSYLRTHQTGQPFTVLVFGLVITGLITGLMLVLTGKTRKVEELVTEKTADLQTAGILLREEMDERLKLEEEILEIGSEERQRLGRDLHDSLGQKLTAAQYLSRALAQQLANDASDQQENAKQINTILRDSVSQVRRIAKGLAPVELDDEGLSAALQRLSREASSAFNIDCQVSCSPKTIIMPTAIATHLYHIAQEAINNAIRHGEADQISVSLTIEGNNQGTLLIQDNGNGLPNDEKREKGMGLRIMRHRATVIDGSCLVRNSDKGGVRVECRFTLPPRHI